MAVVRSRHPASTRGPAELVTIPALPPSLTRNTWFRGDRPTASYHRWSTDGRVQRPERDGPHRERPPLADPDGDFTGRASAEPTPPRRRRAFLYVDEDNHAKLCLSVPQPADHRVVVTCTVFRRLQFASVEGSCGSPDRRRHAFHTNLGDGGT